MPLPIALFPDGRLPPRWRRTMVCYLVLSATLLGGIAWQDIWASAPGGS